MKRFRTWSTERAFVKSEASLHSHADFSQRLKEERSRSDRNGKPFSLLLVCVDQVEARGREAGFFLQAIRNFARSVRLPDILGWYTDTEIGLLLPETSEDEARAVLERLKGYLGQMSRCRLGELAGKDRAFRILEYPRTLRESLGSNGNNGSGPRPLDTEAIGDRGASGCAVEWHFLHRTNPCVQSRRVQLRSTLDALATRCLDVAASVMGLIVLSPVMLVIAALIKMTSRGPVLFRQRRLGKDGREFSFLKYRTMVHNCDQEVHRQYVTRLIENRAEKNEAHGEGYFKLVDDPRVTRLGRFLRTTSLDELPQLFNVLKGEMSLVGPRPPIGYEVDRYQTWQIRRLLEIKPGITGLWQVSGRSTTTFDEQVRLDLRYVERQSFWLNLLILFRTFRAVFSMKGAF